MMEMVLTLFLLPLIASMAVLITPWGRWQYVIVGTVFVLLNIASLTLYRSTTPIPCSLSEFQNHFVMLADIVLLLFLFYQGKKFNNLKVMGLAAVQLLLYGYIESIVPDGPSVELVADQLSKFMFLIINGVGGLILLYSVRYMEDESASLLKKRMFIGAMLIFLSIMNLIVCADSILLFFFLFEMTTLASYILIAFRDDEVSRLNALKALWMNQIGGVMILLGTWISITGFDTATFSGLMNHSEAPILLAVAFLSMAALVKGASIPFEGWLLGAMVAPTPVSAMLHSATMVKIAPYLILKLSPLLASTAVGGMIAIIGSLVFCAASYLALSRSVFKEILGYSTVALLGMMMALSAVGSKESISLAMALILFHSLSKALLFLAAGVLEKQHHAKYIEEMKGMVARSEKTVKYILFGFMSLTLPPFGLFMGKLFAIASIASLLNDHLLYLIVLFCLIVGSALLVLLYFKVASALVSSPSDVVPSSSIPVPSGYNIPLMILVLMIIFGAIGYILIQQNIFVVLLALPMLFVFALPSIIRKMDRYDRSKPYHCGEKEVFDSALVYYELSPQLKKVMYWGFGILFIAVAVSGVMS